jgi:tetratricopeptide (TPR) repeat protein
MVERAFELVNAPGASDPVVFAEAHRNLAELRRKQRRLDEAERIYLAGHRRIEEYLRTTPEADVDANAWVVASNLASYLGVTRHESGRSAEAVPLLERTLELKKRYDIPASHVTGITHYHLAQALQASGRLADAESHLVQALDTHLVSLQPGDPRFIYLYAVGIDIALARSDVPAALERSQRAMAIAREAADVPPRALAIALTRRAEALRRAGRPVEARPLLEEALSVAREVGANREVGHAELGLGRVALDEGDDRAAEVHLSAAREHLLAFFGSGNPVVAEIDALLARARAGAGAAETTR